MILDLISQFLEFPEHFYHEDHQTQTANFAKEPDDSDADDAFWISKPWLAGVCSLLDSLHSTLIP